MGFRPLKGTAAHLLDGQEGNAPPPRRRQELGDLPAGQALSSGPLISQQPKEDPAALS